MRHFYRSHLPPATVLASADEYFPKLGLERQDSTPRSRTFTGPLGALRLSAKAEGGHYTFVEARTDQIGESRLDRNVKRFFNTVHRAEDPSHTLEASY